MKRLTKIIILFWVLLPLWTAADSFLLTRSGVARSVMLTSYSENPQFFDYFKSFFWKNLFEVFLLTIGIMIGKKYSNHS